jgi:hypothetical protein
LSVRGCWASNLALSGEWKWVTFLLVFSVMTESTAPAALLGHAAPQTLLVYSGLSPGGICRLSPAYRAIPQRFSPQEESYTRFQMPGKRKGINRSYYGSLVINMDADRTYAESQPNCDKGWFPEGSHIEISEFFAAASAGPGGMQSPPPAHAARSAENVTGRDPCAVGARLWPERCAGQAAVLAQAQHEVGVLHCLARGALAQVIDGAEGDDQVALRVGGV